MLVVAAEVGEWLNGCWLCRVEVTTGANDHQQRMGTGCCWLRKVKGRLRREDRGARSGLGSPNLTSLGRPLQLFHMLIPFTKVN